MMKHVLTLRKQKYCMILLFATLFLLPCIAFADTLTVTTDKSAYAPGETMKISALYKKNDGTPITTPRTKEVRIKDSAGTELVKTRMAVAGNGVYTYTYKLAATARAGTWEIRARFRYGNVETTAYANPNVATSTADTTAPVTTASPAGGNFSGSVTVALTSNEAGTTYYTTNGTTPTTSSPVYSSPLTFTVSTTLRYFSRDAAGNEEAIKTQIYTATQSTDHTNLTWNGYGTCISCHKTQAQAMYQSVHYQWRGSAAKMSGGPAIQGKMDAIDGSSALNAYCINIQGNWKPCGTCHTGTGAKPVATTSPTDAQLASIDCLLCHNDTVNAPYSRVRNATTGLFEPAAGIDMNLVARRANNKPERTNCLSCHAKAGGGDAVKRGDIASASGTTADDLYDVHMATDRGNLTCQSCHTTSSHRIAGRGSDLRPQDSTVAMSCSTSSCHSGKTSLTSGHSSTDISHHVGRVACQTCHIPEYAKNANDTAATEATETYRDWQTAEWNAALNRYEPTPTKANNLKPRYAFWDGTSWGNNAFDTAVIDPVTGAYKVSRPNGTINGAVGTKLYPFKYKTASQPLANGKLITLSSATYFATGNYDQAVLDGMAYMGLSGPYTTVTTDEYQALNHQVPPATGNVLDCAACHPNSTATRMKLVTDFGYATLKPQSDLCNDCHGLKSWPGYKSFHEKHVTSKRYDCSRCHSFSRKVERGLN